MANTSLHFYKSFNGAELVIDEITGEAFTTERGYTKLGQLSYVKVQARMKAENSKASVSNYAFWRAGKLEVGVLIPAKTVLRWLIKDYPAMALAMGTVGATQYLHKLAGYEHPVLPHIFVDYQKLKAELKQDIADGFLDMDDSETAQMVQQVFKQALAAKISTPSVQRQMAPQVELQEKDLSDEELIGQLTNTDKARLEEWLKCVLNPTESEPFTSVLSLDEFRMYFENILESKYVEAFIRLNIPA